MEVWTRPRRTAAGVSSAKPLPAMSLLFSLTAAAKASLASAAGHGSGSGASGGGGTVSSSGLDLALAAPPVVGVYSGGGGAEAGVAPGDAVRLALRLSAGQAGDRDAVTEVRLECAGGRWIDRGNGDGMPQGDCEMFWTVGARVG